MEYEDMRKFLLTTLTKINSITSHENVNVCVYLFSGCTSNIAQRENSYFKWMNELENELANEWITNKRMNMRMT